MDYSSAILLAALAAAGGGGGTPEDLAASVGHAIETGDVDALLANANPAGSSPHAQLPLVMLISDCVGGMQCAVAARPRDPESLAELRAQKCGARLELPQVLDGVIEITGRDESGSYLRTIRTLFPYTNVGGKFVLELGRYPAAKEAELCATKARGAAAKTFGKDPEWKKSAQPLPEDGGGPGKAFVAQIKALAAAVPDDDVDAAASLLGDWGRRVLGPTDRNGKLMPREHRLRRLHVQARRLVLQAKVLGGWQRGDEAIVIVDGVNGAGWIVRGAARMARTNGRWQFADGDAVEVSPNCESGDLAKARQYVECAEVSADRLPDLGSKQRTPTTAAEEQRTQEPTCAVGKAFLNGAEGELGSYTYMAWIDHCESIGDQATSHALEQQIRDRLKDRDAPDDFDAARLNLSIAELHVKRNEWELAERHALIARDLYLNQERREGMLTFSFEGLEEKLANIRIDQGRRDLALTHLEARIQLLDVLAGDETLSEVAAKSIHFPLVLAVHNAIELKELDRAAQHLGRLVQLPWWSEALSAKETNNMQKFTAELIDRVGSELTLAGRKSEAERILARQLPQFQSR